LSRWAANVAVGAVDSKETERIAKAAAVLNEIHTQPDKGVPQGLWTKAACVVVPSVKKGAFIVEGEYGRGLTGCRQSGSWSRPVFMQLGKGSVGLQIGGEEVDLLLLVMNERGMQKLLGDRVTLGGEGQWPPDRSVATRKRQRTLSCMRNPFLLTGSGGLCGARSVSHRAFGGSNVCRKRGIPRISRSREQRSGT
jgi:hypothetical protein